MNFLTVETVSQNYPIYIESDGLEKVGEILTTHRIGKNLVLISDSNVIEIYGEKVLTNLGKHQFQITELTVPAGENSKSLSTFNELIGKMIKKGVDRSATVIALGGGVVGDLAGFVAASFMRGIPFVQLPTTLLAQTDSSVGGKVGINHRFGKNLIGAFYQPKLVLIDPLVLKTLDKREIYSGLGEIIKYGLIRDKALVELLERDIEKFTAKFDFDFISQVIRRCCQIKADIVSRDEKESDLRRILNFGHTIGHAIEAATKYNHYQHGEAVMLGMLGMSWLSLHEKLISIPEFMQIEKLLSRFPLQSLPENLTTDRLMKKTAIDKKRMNGKLAVVLLNGIGEAIIRDNFDQKKLKPVIDYLIKIK